MHASCRARTGRWGIACRGTWKCGEEGGERGVLGLACCMLGCVNPGSGAACWGASTPGAGAATATADETRGGCRRVNTARIDVVFCCNARLQASTCAGGPTAASNASLSYIGMLGASEPDPPAPPQRPCSEPANLLLCHLDDLRH
eukprot:47747-Chlamydomonas_euryale.AAC.1